MGQRGGRKSISNVEGILVHRGLANLYQKILILLDGSDLAECTLEHAKAVIKGCNVSDVTVFRAIEPFSALSISALAEAAGDNLKRVMEQSEQETQEYVARVKNNLEAQGIASKAITVKGRAAEEILNYAEKNGIDLIVMSTHGRSGLSRFLFVRAAEKVSRHSLVPGLHISPEGCRNVAI
jgi:nucleotide-binding universal stress UspA family protein